MAENTAIDAEMGQPGGRLVLLCLLILAAIPFLGAQFGSGNQAEQLSVVFRLADPGFAPGDFYVDSAATIGQPRYYYAQVLRVLSAVAPLSMVIMALTAATNLALAAVTYLVARRLLSASAVGALIAATLAVINGSFSLGLAGYLHFDSFQPASPAIALALTGFACLMTGRVWWALAAFLAASLMHPTLGTEIAGLAYAGVGGALVIGMMRGTATPRDAGPLAASGALFLAGVAIAWGLPNIGADGARLSNAEFFAILAEFRAPHHYLGLDFWPQRWLEAGLFVGAGTVLFAMHVARHGMSRTHLALALVVIAVIGLCLISLWFVDIAQSRVWVTAQVFRMTMLIKWTGFMLVGWVAGRWLAGGRLSDMALVATVVAASADANAYVLALVLAARFAMTWLRLAPALQLAAVVPLAVVAALVNNRYGIDLHTLRGLIAVLAIGLVFYLPAPRIAGAAAALGLTAAMLVWGYAERRDGLFGRVDMDAQFGWSDLTDDASDIARAAGHIGGPGDLWMVPPTFEMFRVIARRPVVVDFTSLPFDDAGMREWKTRLETIFGPVEGTGFRAQANLDRAYRAGLDLARAAETYGFGYAVLYADTPWDGPVLAENATYKLVRISTPG